MHTIFMVFLILLGLSGLVGIFTGFLMMLTAIFQMIECACNSYRDRNL